MGYGSTLQEISWTIGAAGSVLSRVAFPRISRVGIATTWDCNQRCKTCNIWRINRDNPGLRQKEMTIEEFQKFCDNNPGIMWICLSGGEPTLKKGFGDFLASACNVKGVRLINMSTNGQKPEVLTSHLRNALSKVDKYLKVAVDVSLEGIGEAHDLIAGRKGSFASALDTYERVKGLSEEDSRVLPKFEYTISRYNIGKLQEVLDFLDSRYGLRRKDLILTVAMEASYFNVEDTGEFQIEREALKAELEPVLGRFSARDRLNLFSGINYKFLQGAISTRKPRNVGLRYSILIDPYWNVYSTTFHCPDLPAGNLRELDFNLSNLDSSSCGDDSCKPQWTACEAYPALIFRPWRIL